MLRLTLATKGRSGLSLTTNLNGHTKKGGKERETKAEVDIGGKLTRMGGKAPMPPQKKGAIGS
jgi:hypothetical protein